MTADGQLRRVELGEIPILGVDELFVHVDEIEKDPSTPFVPSIFETVQFQLTEENIPYIQLSILPSLVGILKTTTQDPSPLIELLIALMSPLTFRQVLQFADTASLLSAMRSPLPGPNRLALEVVQKAANTTRDVELLATMPDIVEELLKRWLETEDIGVATRAQAVLENLLTTDCAVIQEVRLPGERSSSKMSAYRDEVARPPRLGTGVLWTRIFDRRQNLGIIVDACTRLTRNRTHRLLSISQCRLLRLLCRIVVLDNARLVNTRHPDLFPLPASMTDLAGTGLLQWAALGMVDKTDELAYLNLVDFFDRYVSVARVLIQRPIERPLPVRDAAQKPPERVSKIKGIIVAAIKHDSRLREEVHGLPDRTVLDEAEPLRAFIAGLSR